VRHNELQVREPIACKVLEVNIRNSDGSGALGSAPDSAVIDVREIATLNTHLLSSWFTASLQESPKMVSGMGWGILPKKYTQIKCILIMNWEAILE